MTNDKAYDHKANAAETDNDGRESENEEGFGRTSEPEDQSRVPHEEPPGGIEPLDHSLTKRMRYQLS